MSLSPAAGAAAWAEAAAAVVVADGTAAAAAAAEHASFSPRRLGAAAGALVAQSSGSAAAAGGFHKQLPPLSSSATAAAHPWHVLISTEVYGETLATFSKRKQIEFLEALSQTVHLTWEWGSAHGGLPAAGGKGGGGGSGGGSSSGKGGGKGGHGGPRSLGTIAMHGIVVVPGAAIRAVLHLHADALDDVHAAVAKLDSVDFAHALAEQFAEMQYKKELIIKNAKLVLAESGGTALHGKGAAALQKAAITFESMIVNEQPTTFTKIKQHELLVCIATLVRVGYKFGGSLNDPMGWAQRRGYLEVTSVEAGRFAGSPSIRIHMRIHTNAHMAAPLLQAVESSTFVANLTPMIAPMMAVVGTKKINLVDFRWAFIGGADDAARTSSPITVMLNYLLEDEPASLFTLYRQHEFCNAVAAAIGLPPRQVRVGTLKNHKGGSHISLMLYFGAAQCGASKPPGPHTPAAEQRGACDPRSPGFACVTLASRAFQNRVVKRLQQRGVRIRVGADDVLRQTAVAVRRTAGWWAANKFAYVSTKGWGDIVDSEVAGSGVRVKSIVIGLGVAGLFATLSVRAAEHFSAKQAAQGGYSRVNPGGAGAATGRAGMEAITEE